MLDQKQKPVKQFTDFIKLIAERKGFEPSKQFPVYTLSRRAPSTTRTPLFVFKAAAKVIVQFHFQVSNLTSSFSCHLLSY